MAEYIEREAVRNRVCSGCIYRDGPQGCTRPEPCEDLIGAFLMAPATDVAPVVRGRWVKHNVDGTDMFGEPTKIVFACNCSVCGLDGRSETPYCPNCGADMRVGKAEKLESHSKEDGE